MMNVKEQTIRLSNGNEMPTIGLGTWRGSGVKDDVTPAITHALKSGYKLIDTAVLYETEDQVGRAMTESGVKREDLWITTKIWPTDYEPKKMEQVFTASLNRLKSDYVDLLLLHWPMFSPPYDGFEPMEPAWRKMEELCSQGKARNIGVSNFQPWHLDSLMQIAKIKPVVNQVEIHPWLPQEELVQACQKHGVACQAYRPFGNLAKAATVEDKNDLLIHDTTITSIADKHKVTPAQVILSWLVKRGIPSVPKSANPARLEQNLQLVELSDEDVKKISNLPQRKRFCPWPGGDHDPFKAPA